MNSRLVGSHNPTLIITRPPPQLPLVLATYKLRTWNSPAEQLYWPSMEASGEALDGDQDPCQEWGKDWDECGDSPVEVTPFKELVSGQNVGGDVGGEEDHVTDEEQEQHLDVLDSWMTVERFAAA